MVFTNGDFVKANIGVENEKIKYITSTSDDSFSSDKMV